MTYVRMFLLWLTIVNFHYTLINKVDKPFTLRIDYYFNKLTSNILSSSLFPETPPDNTAQFTQLSNCQ